MKNIYVLFSILSLSLFIAGCGVFVPAFAHNHFSNHRECADFTTHIEHSHLISFGEEIHPGNLLDEAKNNGIQTIPLFDISSENNYISFVWQPPKHS